MRAEREAGTGVHVCAEHELLDGTMICRVVGGISVLVIRMGTEVVGVKNLCPHQDLPLEGGRLRRGSIFCPHHGARFDLRTGASLSTLTTEPLTIFPARLVDGHVEMWMDQIKA